MLWSYLHAFACGHSRCHGHYFRLLSTATPTNLLIFWEVLTTPSWFCYMWNISQEGHRLHSLFLSVLNASCRYKCGMHELFLLDTILGFMWRVHLPGMLSTASTRHRCVEVELSAARALRCISPRMEGRMFSYFWVPWGYSTFTLNHSIIFYNYLSYIITHTITINTYVSQSWTLLRYDAWFHKTRITSVPVFSSFLV